MLAQRLAFEQLGDQIRRPIVGTDVVQREDVGMVQRRGRARFLFEALQRFGVGRASGAPAVHT